MSTQEFMIMASVDRDEAVRRLIDSAFEDDEPARRTHRKLLEEDFSTQADFLRNDLGLVLEAYANQRTTPASKMPNAVWPSIDHSEFKAEIPHIAYRYTLLSTLRAKRITDFLCRALLASEIYPLAREMDNPHSVLASAVGQRATFQLEKQERGSGLATAGGILLLLMAVTFALAGIFLISVILLGLTLWIFISKSNKRKAVRSVLGEVSIGLRAAHMQLTQIRDEIGGGKLRRRNSSESAQGR